VPNNGKKTDPILIVRFRRRSTVFETSDTWLPIGPRHVVFTFFMYEISEIY
jgi:hypothetical protein